MTHLARGVLSTLVIAFAGTALIGCDDDQPQTPDAGDEGIVDVGDGLFDGWVEIISPTEGQTLTGSDDLDGAVADGVRIEVAVEARGSDDGQVSISAESGPPVIAAIVDGIATASIVLPSEMDGEIVIRAEIQADGAPLVDTVTVDLAVRTCAIDVEPAPSGGCDRGAADDLDPDTPGLQTTLTVTSDCDRITLIVGGVSTPIELDGTAELPITLGGDETSVEIIAAADDARDGAWGPVVYQARTTPPTLALDLRAGVTHVLGLRDEDGVALEGDRAFWSISGTALGLEPGAEVTVAYLPALPDAPDSARVDGQGAFTLEPSRPLGETWEGTVTVTGVDACGTPSPSAVYDLALDAVTPVMRLTAPVDGIRLTALDDIDPDRPDIQIPFTIEVDDPRPGLDYDLSVACGPVGGELRIKTLGADDLSSRSRAAEQPVIATFRVEETGEIVCEPFATPFPNPAITESSLYRLFFETLVFTVDTPARDAGCLVDDQIEVAGQGPLLDGNDPALSVVPTSADGVRLPPVALEPVGGGRYAARLGPDALPDGRYGLAVSGTVFDRVPIDVVPAIVDAVIDRTPPSVVIESPSEPFLDDVDPATAGFQMTPTLRICGAGAQPVTVAFDPPVAGSPFTVEVPAGECPQVTTPTITAPVGPIRVTATVADACGNQAVARRSTRIDPARISVRIISPADGSGIDAAVDDDPERAGCQIALDGLVAGPGPDTRYAVCSTAGDGALTPDCAGRRDALDDPCVVMGVAEAGTTIRCPLDLPDGLHVLTLVATSAARTTSDPVQVQVDCTPPAVRALSVIDDSNDDGCINRHERINAAEAGDNARVRVAFEVEGLADGRPVRLRTDSGLDLGGATVRGGVGEATVSLPLGAHRLYLRGQDEAGNALPEPADDPLLLAIEVDTRPPQPSLAGLDAGVCLNALDDTDPDRGGMQYGLDVRAGRTAGETVTAAVSIDGGEPTTRSGALDLIAFDGLVLPEGDLALRVTVSDACGNVGSIDGFEMDGALPDWSRPLPISVAVDTIPPELALVGLDPGAVLDGDDDADADPQNGFQIDLMVEVAGLEAASRIDLDADDAPIPTDPAPLLADDGGLVPARLTLSGGPQTLTAHATDACGNPASSAPLPLTVDIAGCASRIVGLDGNPSILSERDGAAGPAGLAIDVDGRVELLDAACAGAPVELLIDGTPTAGDQVAEDGAVRFEGVVVPEGEHTLALRVGPVGDVILDSPSRPVVVDFATPMATIIRPVGPDPASVLTDDRPEQPGQQITVVVEVREDRVDAPRIARLTLDGQPVAERPVPDGDPATVSFADVTVPAGRAQLEVCITDGAAHESCMSRTIDADPAAPDTVGPIEVGIVDPRSTEVSFAFTAPGDDGVIGAVTAYALRRADGPFADEGDWAAAAGTEVRLPAVAAAGALETLTVIGPGPTLADGLQLDRQHAVAIRAVDDAGQLGPLAFALVDLRLGQRIGRIPARGGAWEGGDVINTTSPVIGVGDLDRDGFDDLVVAVSQSATATGAAFVFGGEDQGSTRSLRLAPGMGEAFFGVVAAAAGDLNGDGADDVAVQGYLDGFAGSAIALYFGCAAEPCDRDALVEPDALVVSVGGRFTNAVAGVGDVWKPTGGGFDDLLISGALGGENTAFVVAGRADWPELPGVIEVGPGGAGPRVVTVTVPEGPSGVYGAGVGDLDGDGFDDMVLSAGEDIDQSYLFYGGPWPGAVRFVEGDPDTVQLVDPCPGPNSTFGTAFVGGVDLDGDVAGRPDFIVGNRSNKRVVVFDADRDVLDCFGRSPVRFGQFVDLAGDVDGDGSIDVIVTHGDQADTDAYIFYNDGLGRFGVGEAASPRGAHVVLDDPAARKLGVAGAGDFDGDGRADVAAVYLDGDAGMTWIVYD